jgi:PAS domain S-box-containing protein
MSLAASARPAGRIDGRLDGCQRERHAAALARAAPLLEGLWAAPLPATLQGDDYRILDVNEAFVQLRGQPREALVGQDPTAWQPKDDHELSLELRAVLASADAPRQQSLRRRILDGHGRLRWFSLSCVNLAADGEPALWLSLLHDQTPEHDALQQAHRADVEMGLKTLSDHFQELGADFGERRARRRVARALLAVDRDDETRELDVGGRAQDRHRLADRGARGRHILDD